MNQPPGPPQPTHLAEPPVEVLRAWGLEPAHTRILPIEAGHINQTFLLEHGRRRFIAQRINRFVFREPAAVISNMLTVTRHVREAMQRTGIADLDRRCLHLVPTCDDEASFADRFGDTWRFLPFIENTVTRVSADSPELAGMAARGFGEFQRWLRGIEASTLAETIPQFHDTPHRLDKLREALGGAEEVRLERAAPEIEEVFASSVLAKRLEQLRDSGIPRRVTHNDCKLSNLLLDADSGEALCVIDLDTVMPGLSLFDFGDMARSMSHTTPEDELRLARVRVRPELFEALVVGYVQGAGDLLEPAEIEHLVDAAQVLIFEQAIRFLTDYLHGDLYFRIHRPEHNLERTRSQLALLRSVLAAEAQLRHIVERAAR